MLDNIDRLFQAVKDKAMRIESFLSKAEKHSRPLVEDNTVPFKDSTGTARLVIFVNNGYTQPSFGKQTGSGQAG
jgi:hypothetical protein